MRKKNKYLYQLIITSAILIIVPTIFFFTFFLERSFKTMNNANTEYCENITNVFASTFVEAISEFKEQILLFSVNSREKANGSKIFYEGSLKMQENAYYYWEACLELQEFSNKSGTQNFGVLYYDNDFILYDSMKCSVDWLIQNILGINVERKEDYEQIKKFFSSENFENAKVVMMPLYDKEGNYQETLVGVCTLLGKTKEKALCFYRMKQEDLQFFYQSVQGRTWERYYVIDEKTEQLVYGVGQLEQVDYEEMLNAVLRNESKRHSRKEIYVSQNTRYDLIFALDISGDKGQDSVYQFYVDMKTYIIYVVLLMIVISCLAVYLNYHPVRTLLKKMNVDDKDEFDGIFNSWEAQKLRLTEQRVMIMDLIMNHLLYGLPLSDEQVDKLGVSESVKNYCVFLIENYVLLSEETAQIIEMIEREFRTLLFVTDLQGEASTVIVAFMEKNESEEISCRLASWCLTHITDEYYFYKGCVVERLGNIRNSLLDCKGKAKGQSTFSNQTESTKEASNKKKRVESYEVLKEEIFEYLEANYNDQDLTQTKVADRFNVSVYSLSRIFKKQFGMGFSEYINGKRVEKSKEFLQKTDLSIREISTMVGFSDSNYFAKIFRNNVGVSPTEFRKVGEE